MSRRVTDSSVERNDPGRRVPVGDAPAVIDRSARHAAVTCGGSPSKRLAASPCAPSCSMPSGPTDLLEVVDRLTFLQLDPTAVVAPSADLVAWSRLGNSYDPAQLQQALERRPHAVRVPRPGPRRRATPGDGAPDGEPRPLPRGHGRLAAAQPAGRRGWLDANRRSAERARACCARPARCGRREIPDTAAVPWASSGWTNERNVTQLLEFLAAHGEVAVAARRGRHRLWDLAERVYPIRALPVVPADEARRIRDEKRLRSLGVARRRSSATPASPRRSRARRANGGSIRSVSADDFAGRTAVLSPFDRLIHNRARAARPVRVRVPPRDVQAEGEAALGVLRPARAPRRSADRQGRRRRRSQDIAAPCRRHPRGRAVHTCDEVGGRRRAAFAGGLAATSTRCRSRRPDPSSGTTT